MTVRLEKNINGESTKINAILKEHIQKQEKNEEFKLSIDELKEQMAAMIRQQTVIQNSKNRLLGHEPEKGPPPRQQRISANETWDQVTRVKFKVPEFNGDTCGDVFLDWIYNLETFFRWHNMSDARKAYFAEVKLRGTTPM